MERAMKTTDEMEEALNRELQAAVMPDGAPVLEWTDASARMPEATRRFQEKIYDRYETGSDGDWLLLLAFSGGAPRLHPSLEFFRDVAVRFGRKATRTPDLEEIRENVEVRFPAEERREVLDRVPDMAGAEYIGDALLLDIWGRLHRAFAEAVRDCDGTVEAFIQGFSPDLHLAGRVYFHLVENPRGDRPFAFLATYSTRLDSEGKSRHIPLKHALQEYDEEELLELLSTVYRAADGSRLVADLVESGELFHPLSWNPGEAHQFLREIPIYETAGILCRIPDWWRGGAASVRLDITLGDAAPSHVGMNALVQFDPRLYIGDEPITEAEARDLLSSSEGLALIKNRWVAVDPDKLSQTLDAYDQVRDLMDQGFSLREAMRMQLQPERFLKDGIDPDAVSVSTGDWLASVMEKLRDPSRIGDEAPEPGDGFRADLRPYQERGVHWLSFLHSMGFGACLADDMGLGKTVQLLAFLSIVKAQKPGRASLLILPASLISNWIREIERFYPDLKFFAAHPDAQPKGKTVRARGEKALDRLDLVITTYALSQRYKWLADYPWHCVILDEAQAIKNPGTKQTQAVKGLSAVHRIALTGTPIENRLGDLWSLFDFLNPGLLGSKTEFVRFTKSLKDDPSGYARLRKVVSPYILRRLKTDRSVISDLPDKVEMKTYASLSRKQVVLYQKMISELEAALNDSEGIQRKGLVLSSLMKFKQLCNHPDQYLGGGEFAEKDSGKFDRLREICGTIHEKRERVLVFTQFKEMTGPLSGYLASIFGREGLVLHGGVPVGRRKKIIERFQDRDYIPFMVLSLKAGGVGLNLTRANHVIHFDRWWNPAVENQATDRAFRIGQKKNVVVHKFVTRGTVEEKIDAMLTEKAKMSAEVVGDSGEAWITEMDNKELMSMFQLTL
jgi:superfamily II DNA or RNA helicase